MNKKQQEKRSGYALLTVIGIMTILSITFFMLHKSGQQSVFTGNLLIDRTKATVYAEAGVEFAYSILREDYNNYKVPDKFRVDTSSTYAEGTPLESDYEDGTFILSIMDVHSNGQYVIINSIGKCGASEVEVEALVEDENFTPTGPVTPKYDEMEAFKRGIAGGSTGKFGGGGALLAGNPELIIHTNGDIVLGGDIDVEVSITSSTEIDMKKKDVNGSVSAPVVANNDDNVPETIGVVPEISTPDIDFTPFFNEAKDNGQTYTVDKTFGDWEIPGGIVYVDGDVMVKGNVVGTIIATGSIKILSGGIKESGYGIAAGTYTGNITDNSVSDSEGLFYSRSGDFTQGAAGGTLTGQIIVGGTVDKTGGKSIIFDLSLPEPPGTTDPIVSGARPVIAGWQK